jgi:hypothetical protein
MKHKQKAVIYLDWVNNFISVEGFASYYGVTVEVANKLIEEGREIHENLAKQNKTN